jgi:integrase/recombinase XerD
MSGLRQRLLEDLQLRGYSAGTQQLYGRAVRPLAEYAGKSPAQITEEELRQYVL